MKALKRFVQNVSAQLRLLVQPVSQSEFRKAYLGYQKLVDALLIAEKNLTKNKERRRPEYEAIREDAIILRKVIMQRPDAIKFDFLTENLRGITMRCSLVIKNIEMKVRNTNYHPVKNLRGGIRRDEKFFVSSFNNVDNLDVIYPQASNILNVESISAQSTDIEHVKTKIHKSMAELREAAAKRKPIGVDNVINIKSKAAKQPE